MVNDAANKIGSTESQFVRKVTDVLYFFVKSLFPGNFHPINAAIIAQTHTTML